MDNFILMTGFISIPPIVVVFAVVALVVMLLGGLHFAYYVRPRASVEINGTRIEVFCIPGWSLRKVPKTDAFVVFTNATGWLGHGTNKYVKDKADFGLDDEIEKFAPIPVEGTVSVPVKRLPAKLLVAANIYDEKGLTHSIQFQKGFDSAIQKLLNDGMKSLMVCDPTDDWNYFEHRAESALGAQMLINAILKYSGKLKIVRILVVKPQNLEAYTELLRKISEERWRYAVKA